MKRFFAVLGILCLALGLVGGVLADEQGPQEVDATINVTGGALEVYPKAIEFEEVALDGTNHPNVPGASVEAWGLLDASGTGAGYYVNINATDFFNEDGNENHIIDNAGFGMTLLDENIEGLDETNGVKPVSNFATEKPLADDDQMLLSAVADQGQGSWEFTPSFTLDVPATTYAGEYTSTVTATIVAGPAE